MELTQAVVLMCSVYVAAPAEMTEAPLEADFAAQRIVRKVQMRMESTVHSWPVRDGMRLEAARKACRAKAISKCTEVAKPKAPGPCRFELHDAQASKGWAAATAVEWPKAKKERRVRKKRIRKTKKKRATRKKMKAKRKKRAP